MGIVMDTCLMVVNSVLRERIDEKDFVEVLVGFMMRLVKENKELLTLMKDNSIDSKHFCQADKNNMQGLLKNQQLHKDAAPSG